MKLLLATAVTLSCSLITHAQEKAEALVEQTAGTDQEAAAGEPDEQTKAGNEGPRVTRGKRVNSRF